MIRGALETKDKLCYLFETNDIGKPSKRSEFWKSLEYVTICYLSSFTICLYLLCIRVGNCHPDPRGTPSPAPKLGDGVGTGELFQNLRGRGGDGGR